MAEVLVPVQVCGRRESLPVSRLSAQDLAHAVERCFGVRPPFLFADHRGRPLPDDRAIALSVQAGETLVVKLTEGVMHDLHRRVDQLRHLQWGLVCDQLAAVKRESAERQGFGGQPADVRQLGQALEQERVAREALQERLLHELDTLREAGHKAWRAEVLELRQQVVDMRQALMSDRSPGSSRQPTSVAERVRRGSEQLEAGAKLELLGVSRTVRELESAMAELRRDQAQLVEQLHQGHSTLQQAHSTARGELSHQVDAIRFQLEQEIHERELMSRNIEQLSQDVAREMTRERAEVRRSSVSEVNSHTEGLQRTILECQAALDAERQRRSEIEEKLRELHVQGKDRTREMQGLMSQLTELRGVYGSMKDEVLGTLEDLHGRLNKSSAGGSLADDLAKLREDCREALQREVRLRTDHDRALEQALEQLREGLETHTHNMQPHGVGHLAHSSAKELERGQAPTEGSDARGGSARGSGGVPVLPARTRGDPGPLQE